MITVLPTTIEIGGIEYNIRSDYRAALDICAAFADLELDNTEKALVALFIFYPDFETIPAEYVEEAYKKLCWFIDCGSEPEEKRTPKLVDWEQDFQYIVAPINRVMGQEIRAAEYMHWWTFISAYYEIGDCVLAQIVRIRSLLAKGKPLDKADREWYRENRKIVDIKTKYSNEEDELLKMWGGA